jgi:glutathione synthase/RimK-type ligase-like ATP-grasp enzyme
MLRNKYKKIFIAKPSCAACGDGIHLIRKLSEIPSKEKKSWNNCYIVQEYISEPLLLNYVKFDFRIYVLIQSIDPFVVFIAKENMVRFCVEEYKDPNKSNDKGNIYS